VLPASLALILGPAAALLAACGQGTRAGIPAERAQALKQEIGDVREFADRGDCAGLNGQLRQVRQRIDNLPASVSDRLVTNLREGVVRLESVALEQCNATAAPDPDPAPTTDTEPPATTDTQPTETEPPATTDTQPTETEPPPTDTVPTEPPPSDDGEGEGEEGGAAPVVPE